ncbi:MAG: uridine kinase [Actinomycetes bacterium]
MTTLRAALVESVAREVLQHRRLPITRVAVDGVDGAGKTFFADELADCLVRAGVVVIRAGADGFHRPAVERYRRGRSSPEGFFLDSYDYAALRSELLDPLSPGGALRYRLAVFDVASDEPLDLPPSVADIGAVLVVDGIFLHRDELVDVWDFSVFIRASLEQATRRWQQRDGVERQSASIPGDRYVEGQRLYLNACDPQRRASMVVDNNDFAAPFVVRGGEPGTTREPQGLV